MSFWVDPNSRVHPDRSRVNDQVDGSLPRAHPTMSMYSGKTGAFPVRTEREVSMRVFFRDGCLQIQPETGNEGLALQDFLAAMGTSIEAVRASPL